MHFHKSASCPVIRPTRRRLHYGQKCKSNTATSLVAALVQIPPYKRNSNSKIAWCKKNENVLKIMSFFFFTFYFLSQKKIIHKCLNKRNYQLLFIISFHYSVHVANWLEMFTVHRTKGLSSPPVSFPRVTRLVKKKNPADGWRHRMWRQRTREKHGPRQENAHYV